MFGLVNPLKIKVKPGSCLTVSYKSRDDSPIYDLCDFDGNLIETGKLKDSDTELSIKDLAIGVYYLFILDGPHIHSKKFSV